MAGRSVSLTAEHDVNDAPETVAVDEDCRHMPPPYVAELDVKVVPDTVAVDEAR